MHEDRKKKSKGKILISLFPSGQETSRSFLPEQPYFYILYTEDCKIKVRENKYLKNWILRSSSNSLFLFYSFLKNFLQNIITWRKCQKYKHNKSYVKQLLVKRWYVSHLCQVNRILSYLRLARNMLWIMKQRLLITRENLVFSLFSIYLYKEYGGYKWIIRLKQGAVDLA